MYIRLLCAVQRPPHRSTSCLGYLFTALAVTGFLVSISAIAGDNAAHASVSCSLNPAPGCLVANNPGAGLRSWIIGPVVDRSARAPASGVFDKMRRRWWPGAP